VTAVRQPGTLRVLVCGGANGVGLACAEAFAARGAELILADCDGIALTRAADRLNAFSRYCDAIAETSVEAFAEEMNGRFSSIDVLINAAGRGYVRALAMTRMSRAMLPLLRRGRGYRLIANIGSGGGFASSDGLFPYASSQVSFKQLSNSIAEQSRATGIEVVQIAPRLLRGRQANSHWSDRLYLLQRVDEQDAAERLVARVSVNRPEWRQRPTDLHRRA
jgi:NAD(P)-dependent dehydrogenase (short-subunit alcohol dehydrogenase family)